jgi:CheY-like chemotaxis protein
MSLRCLVFSSDEGTAHSIGLVLADLGMEAEYCHVAVEAVQRVTSELFQIVIADWDDPAEAGFLIKTARERKASERPLNLAIVSDDASVPSALQAGANSVLRKPVLANQVRDTLTTARDLLRSRLEAPAPMARAAAAAVSSPAIAQEPIEDNPLRGGEFLQTAAPSPGAHFITDSDAQRALDQPPVGEVDALQELTSMAEAVQSAAPVPAPIPKPAPKTEERRGLEWYLKNRPAPAAPPAVAPAPEQPEMLGYDETPAYSGNTATEAAPAHAEPQSLEDALAKSRRAQRAENAHPEQEQRVSP